jgi:hypothetical protein
MVEQLESAAEDALVVDGNNFDFNAPKIIHLLRTGMQEYFSSLVEAWWWF